MVAKGASIEVSDSGAAPSASEVHENAVTNVYERQQNENIANTVQNINADEQQDDGVEIAGPSRCESVMLATRKRELCFSNDGRAVDDDNASDENVSLLDYECDSQGGSVCGLDGGSQDMSTKDPSLYTLEEINGFLDETFGKQVNIKEFFPDVGKFERSVAVLQKTEY